MSQPDHPTTGAAATSSHMMKVTKRGRPYLKDTMDLFATLVVSLRLTTHQQYFRRFPHSFNTDEAAANLASLKFSQSNRGPDPRDPSRIVTTTTTTTFSMTREMAKAMCQHFMDARLIENAADPNSNLFKDRGTYVLTPKGLHVLERFIAKNGMNADHLSEVFETQPICMKLLHLERRAHDDEIIVSQGVITTLFRRFVGHRPNYRPANYDQLEPRAQYQERAKGINFVDLSDRNHVAGRGGSSVHKYCFQAVTGLEWLCDFTSVVGREEAAEMAAQFVRFGLITLMSDKRKNNDSAIIFTVRGSTPGGSSPIMEVGEFRCTTKAVYKLTPEGIRVARWDQHSPSTSNAHLPGGASDDGHSADLSGSDATLTDAQGAKLTRRMSLAERGPADDRRVKESNTDRLKYILEEPQLRSLFREFLRANFCEENLSFWMDVSDFKRKFGVTSSASAAPNASLSTQGASASPAQGGNGGANGGRPRTSPGQQAMERHHEVLISQAWVIYNKYLAPASPCELNIDHNLRNELVAYLGAVMQQLTGRPFSGRVDQDQMGAFNATQLQNMIQLYERIQMHVFRLMATDSVPKFIKTNAFMSVRRQWAEEFDRFDDAEGSGGARGEGEEGYAYLTVSQHASEQEQRIRNYGSLDRPQHQQS